MNCNKVQKLISLYVDNKLSSQEIAELKAHLQQCEKCNQDYITLKNIKNILANTPKKEVSANFTDSVMSKIKNKEYLEKKDNVVFFGAFNSMKKKLVMAAGFLFVVASSSFFFMNNNNISVNQYDEQIYASAIEYCLDYDDMYDYENDEYDEYMLSLFC